MKLANLGSDHPDTHQTRANLGVNYVESEPPLRECLAIREKTQPDAWSTFNTRSVLGGVEELRRRRTAALGRLRGSKAAGEVDPAARRIRLPEALDRLIEFSNATNKPDQVKKWQAERVKYLASVLTPQPKK